MPDAPATLRPIPTPKGWNDQPDEVTALPVVLKFSDGHGRLYELRAESDPWAPTAYLTAGNLFGSTTLRCDTLHRALGALQLVLRLADGKALKSVPTGCTLLPNATDPKES